MSSPSTSAVNSTAASIESASPRPEAGEPWLPKPEELPNTPWYEEKSSNLRTSDIPTIQEKGGLMILSLSDGGYGYQVYLKHGSRPGYPGTDEGRRHQGHSSLLGPYCPAIVWGGEMVRRLTHSHQKVRSTRRNFDKSSRQHTEAVAKLKELEACRARELEEAKTQQELLEAELITEKEARVAEKEAMRAELEEAKARSEQEAERLKGEAREEFLNSPEFDVLLGKRVFSYFKDGLWGCLAQFRANGYSEEEHPASFLDLQEALAKLGDEEASEEEVEEGQEEGEIGSGAEDNPPNSPHP
ncbi:hypothetical protein F511_34819 [Dorcoceras hygrometricum]|uniref:Uncharacterized protein n=1 Tax=Dorcoceras hygrometricum TaxID=472368 RepID=A0A2Z7BJP4_9LAMI|nr:hypothetical protein F511_34819 [Dorcoceras hygrometricum]